MYISPKYKQPVDKTRDNTITYLACILSLKSKYNKNRYHIIVIKIKKKKYCNPSNPNKIEIIFSYIILPPPYFLKQKNYIIFYFKLIFLI
jgi:hypothetical protein